jgi:hypothetical protein
MNLYQNHIKYFLYNFHEKVVGNNVENTTTLHIVLHGLFQKNQ